MCMLLKYVFCVKPKSNRYVIAFRIDRLCGG